MKRLALALALFCTACPKDAEAPSEEDRLIAKLKAEQERMKTEPPGKIGPDVGNPNFNTGEDPLAKTAIEPPARQTLKLPEKLEFQSGPLTVRLTGEETSQSFSSGKVKLSTNEQFLRVDLKLKASGAAEIDLSGATLVAGAESFGIARDVQRVVGAKNLARSVGAGDSFETVLMFELPEAALAKGVVLKLPLAVPLEVPLQ